MTYIWIQVLTESLQRDSPFTPFHSPAQHLTTVGGKLINPKKLIISHISSVFHLVNSYEVSSKRASTHQHLYTWVTKDLCVLTSRSIES